MHSSMGVRHYSAGAQWCLLHHLLKMYSLFSLFSLLGWYFFYCALQHVVLQPQLEDTNDVYCCEKTHTDYIINAVADVSLGDRKEVCSACFFERGHVIRPFTQVQISISLTHFS